MKIIVSLLLLVLVLSLFLCNSLSAQVSGISLGAFGDRHWKAPVATASLLPLITNLPGDTIRTLDDGHVHHWNGTIWVDDGVGGGGTVTSVAASLSGLSWLNIAGSPVTLSGGFIVSPASGQTPHYVLGTFGGSSIILAPLTSADIPSLPYLSNNTNYAASASQGGPATSVASASIINSSVAINAGITESKLALNNPTHSSINDPSTDQKAALLGSNGTPSSINPYVTLSDSSNTNSRTPTAHTHSVTDLSDSTAAGRALMVGANAAAQRSSLGLGTAALEDTSASRPPLAHVHAAGDTTSGVFAGARIPTVDLAHLASTCIGPAKILQWDGTGAASCIATSSGLGGVGLPAGTGSELQSRADASTFAAVTGSSVSGANVTLGGKLGLPSVNGISTPTFHFSTDTGIYEASSGRMILVRHGSASWMALDFETDTQMGIYTSGGNGHLVIDNGALLDGLAPTTSHPSLCPSFSDCGSSGGTGIGWGGDNDLRMIANGISSVGVKPNLLTVFGTLAMTPLASPPFSCTSGVDGSIYYDTSHAMCLCDGSTWVNLNPLSGGSCT